MTVPPSHAHHCRACGAGLVDSFVDLGLSPVSNAFVAERDLDRGEMYYPLHAMVCRNCWLVQLTEVLRADTHFHDDYVYFSSYSSSWLVHAERYVADMVARFALDRASQVIEIASNDGYLLQYFVKRQIPCLGVEPTASTARAAEARGVPTLQTFFDAQTANELARSGRKADLLLGNNVLAHVPDINGFVAAMPILLADEGVITLEFPHLLRLITGQQFDTIYHEHYFYLSLTALLPVFAQAGLRIFDVETLPTHGGSLRIYGCHAGARHEETAAVHAMLDHEVSAGLTDPATYHAFAERVRTLKRDLLAFLVDAKRNGKRIVGYGAAAKGNTLFNYCGIGRDFVDYVVDRNPAKQGKYLPGSRIPVRPPEFVMQDKPDCLLILPWNIKDEIVADMAGIRDWGGQFVVPIPAVTVLR
ncbi:class I SAM-dependent methyltransferase [Jeongeupia sp. USM3]|uniref:class I SAM-dependent methyltransferase n=1 Tax=Jeongeupia sp. USM3 TaxID=1906741 RepID=UPI00089E0957|nr:class I SAM-dependent methyltransferase [Jeongeupia sp. USM3]AOX99297.1 SAM-dependent methyltransferase [Jeongeupia sp. USM3]